MSWVVAAAVYAAGFVCVVAHFVLRAREDCRRYGSTYNEGVNVLRSGEFLIPAFLWPVYVCCGLVLFPLIVFCESVSRFMVWLGTPADIEKRFESTDDGPEEG